MHGAHHIRMDRIACRCTRDSKIHDLYLSLGGDHDILRFDIAVNDIFIMCCFNSPSDLDRNADRLFKCKASLLLYIGL